MTSTSTGPERADSARSGSTPELRRKAAWENVKGLLWVILIFFAVRTFLIEAYRIPSGSMKPTLLVGDWLFVNKLIYGPHVPFTSFNLPGYREPRRGDVAVFKSPYQADEAARGMDPEPTVVKRIVALGGDTIYMRDAQLYVNGEPFSKEHLFPPGPMAQDVVSSAFTWQQQYQIAESRFGPPPFHPSLDNWGPMLVPNGHLFMMGDNRYDSKDSRYWGFVPRENLRGRPLFVYYSWNGEDSDRPLAQITDIRWGRIGHVIR